MPYVELYKLKDNGRQELIATCKLIRTRVECEGDEIFIQNLAEEGIFDYSVSTPSRPKLFFKDGIKFLEQLKYNFHSGYLSASDILGS